MTRRCLLTWLIAAVAVVSGRAQDPDLSKPPVEAPGKGGFSAIRLKALPPVDGREWISVDMASGPEDATLRASDGRFVLRFAAAGEDTGDSERYKLLFLRESSDPVRIDRHFTGWAYLTPDSRYIFTEPVRVIDVRRWQAFDLSALGLTSYVSIHAISRDRRRLQISQVDCPIDCKKQNFKYFVLMLPR